VGWNRSRSREGRPETTQNDSRGTIQPKEKAARMSSESPKGRDWDSNHEREGGERGKWEKGKGGRGGGRGEKGGGNGEFGKEKGVGGKRGREGQSWGRKGGRGRKGMGGVKRGEGGGEGGGGAGGSGWRERRGQWRGEDVERGGGVGGGDDGVRMGGGEGGEERGGGRGVEVKNRVRDKNTTRYREKISLESKTVRASHLLPQSGEFRVFTRRQRKHGFLWGGPRRFGKGGVGW